MERQSKLPEYVGKKIVEALKQDEEALDVLDNDAITISEPATFSNQSFAFTSATNNTTVNVVPTDHKEQNIEISDLDLPDNVMMLVKLINQLPAGVSRQVGAQIIRQTIEAMGISMKSVLSEAQYIQEDLGNSTQDCLHSIEEYKNNIKVLEQKIGTYKKQAAQLGELINLFVLTIK